MVSLTMKCGLYLKAAKKAIPVASEVSAVPTRATVKDL